MTSCRGPVNGTSAEDTETLYVGDAPMRACWAREFSPANFACNADEAPVTRRLEHHRRVIFFKDRRCASRVLKGNITFLTLIHSRDRKSVV